MEELKQKIIERIKLHDEQIKYVEDLLAIKKNELIANIQRRGELKMVLDWISKLEKDKQPEQAEGRE